MHTLSLYKNILNLDAPDLFNDTNNNEMVNIDSVFKQITSVYDKRMLKIIYNTLELFSVEVGFFVKSISRKF